MDSIVTPSADVTDRVGPPWRSRMGPNIPTPIDSSVRYCAAMRAALVAVVLTGLVWMSPSVRHEDEEDGICSGNLTRGIPPRPADAPGGSEIMARIWNLRGAERDAAILQELVRGNVPDFLRHLKPVRLTVDDK